MIEPVIGSDKRHAIHVVFDQDKQTVEVHFNTAEFKTWEFVIGLLESGLEFARTQRQFAIAASIQQQREAQSLVQRINGGRA